MAERVTIDPVTRIEGHLRLELETNNKKITKAWSEATNFRGIETIVQGRDPRDVWAFTQRICGVCTTVHAVASILAVENAIGSQVPKQAQLIRDMVLGAASIQDHVIHFYHLHALDWVNAADAMNGDPAKAVAFADAIGSKWKGNTLARMTEVRDTVKALVESGQLSIFTQGYLKHPAYKLPPEANLMAVAHYLDALEFQRSMIRINTVFGGKNPHPNFLVGGMACSIDPSGSETVNEVQVNDIGRWVAETLEFVRDCYVPDGLAILGAYPEYFDIGASSPNYLAVGRQGAAYAGDPNQAPLYKSPAMDVKAGAIYDDDFTTVHDFDMAKITESIASSWYTYSDGKMTRTPDIGETTVDEKNVPQPPYEWLAESDRYSWAKAPRYEGRPMQVGPIARVLLSYAQGHPRTKELVDMALDKFKIQPKQLNSTAGRTLARAVEALLSAEMMQAQFNEFVDNLKAGDIAVFDASKWEPSSWPKESKGVAFVEVPRGMLSHWVTIKDGAVANYQAVVPTTWNAGGRDENGVQGPYEESLAGNGEHPLVDPTQPVEALRTIHSFDPCLACAVHVLDPDGNELQLVVSS